MFQRTSFLCMYHINKSLPSYAGAEKTENNEEKQVENTITAEV